MVTTSCEEWQARVGQGQGKTLEHMAQRQGAPYLVARSIRQTLEGVYIRASLCKESEEGVEKGCGQILGTASTMSKELPPHRKANRSDLIQGAPPCNKTQRTPLQELSCVPSYQPIVREGDVQSTP